MNKNNKSPTKTVGLTLVEILISMIILGLIMGGLASVFVSTKRLTLHHRFRIVAAELGRYFLDRLQMHVREDRWDDTPNSLPNNPAPNNLVSLGSPPISPRNYRTPNLPVGPGEFPQYAGYQIVTQAEEPGFEEPSMRGITYYPVYQIFNQGGVRKVVLTICWIEPTL